MSAGQHAQRQTEGNLGRLAFALQPKLPGQNNEANTSTRQQLNLLQNFNGKPTQPGATHNARHTAGPYIAELIVERREMDGVRIVSD